MSFGGFAALAGWLAGWRESTSVAHAGWLAGPLSRPPGILRFTGNLQSLDSLARPSILGFSAESRCVQSFAIALNMDPRRRVLSQKIEIASQKCRWNLQERSTFVRHARPTFGVPAKSISKPSENWRSQLFGRGVDFAESIFLLARLAESIFKDVIALKF